MTPTIATVRFCTTLGFAGLLFGCGGGGMSVAPSPPRSTPAAGTPQSVAFVLTIAGPPASRPSTKHRTPKFVSSSTDGVLVQAYAHSDPQHQTLLGSAATDVSSGSAACGGKTGYPRTCTGTAPVPIGDDDFVVTTYDAAPNNNAFAPSANVLGRAAVEEVVQLGAANMVSVYVSGVIASLNAQQAFASLPADGQVHTFAFILQPQDFDNNPITAGNNDPYANPITLTLAETGGTGHATLLLNGTAVGATATVTHSTDTVALRYDGQGTGSPVYSTLTTISAPNVTSTTVRVSPMYVGELDADYPPSNSGTNPPAPVVLPGPGEKAYLFIVEANAPTSAVYTATPSSGCSGVVSVSMSGTSALLTAGPTAAPNGVCTITMSDGMSSVPVTFTNGIAGPNADGPLTVTTYWPPGYRTADYTSVARGPDGAMWFWQGTGNSLSALTRVTAAGAITELTTSSREYGFGITGGPDGNLWLTDRAGIDRVTPAGVWTHFALSSGAVAGGICAGSDGNLWFDESGAIGRITPSGAITEFPLPAGISIDVYWTRRIAEGADGSVWFTADPNAVGHIALDGTITMFPQAMQTSGIAAGPDGNMWFTGGTSSGSTWNGTISKITPSGGTTTYPLPNAGPGFDDLTAGPDGNLWVVVYASAIAKVTIAGTVTEYTVPNTHEIAGIASAPDGSLWLSAEPDLVRIQL
jgi:virginiamycin B lyase